MKIKSKLGVALVALVASLASSGTASAAFIARGAFGPSAITYGFTGVPNLTTVVVAGNLTVSGGEKRSDLFDPPGPMDIENYTNIGFANPPSGQTIRFDFAAPVSAVGV